MIVLGIALPSFSQSSERVELRVGQQKTTSVGHLKIKFVRLMEDSRCPINARCVWAGNAKVRLTVKGSKGSRNIDLNTGVEPHTATYDSYDIRIEDLLPGKSGDPKAHPQPQTLTITVERHK